ncbi:MAG: HlyD family secretion protein [Anaerolineales bacterium]
MKGRVARSLGRLCRHLLIHLLLTLSSLGALTGCSKPGAAQEQVLWASGTLRATGVRVASETGGRVAELHAEPGQRVSTGDVLVVLDATPFLLQLAPAEAAVEVARADLNQVAAGPRAEAVEAARASLALAEAERDGARAAWGHAQEKVEDPQEINTQIVEARSRLALAEQGVELAEAELQETQYLYDRRKANQWELAAAQESLAAAEDDRRAAEALLNRLWGLRHEPLGLIARAHAAEGHYRVLAAGAEVARARLEDLLAGPTPEELAVAEAVVQQAEAEVAVLRARIERCTLRSPLDGVVVQQAIRVGELAAPAATLLTLADLEQLVLEVYVPEGQIGRVRLGQPVAVEIDGYPDRRFEGEVVRIGSEPEFTPRNVATQEGRLNTFYVVDIRLENSGGLLKIGMPADATFLNPGGQ